MKTKTYAFAMMSFAMVVGSVTEVSAEESELGTSVSGAAKQATCKKGKIEEFLLTKKDNGVGSTITDNSTKREFNVLLSEDKQRIIVKEKKSKDAQISPVSDLSLPLSEVDLKLTDCYDKVDARLRNIIGNKIKDQMSQAGNPGARSVEVGSAVKTEPIRTEAEPVQTTKGAASVEVVSAATLSGVGTQLNNAANSTATVAVNSPSAAPAKAAKEQAQGQRAGTPSGSQTRGAELTKDTDEENEDEGSDYASEKMRQCDEKAEQAENAQDPKTELFEKTNFSFPRSMPKEARNKVYTSVYQIKCYAGIIKNAKNGIAEQAKGKKISSKERAELVAQATQEVSQALRDLTVELSKGESKSEQAIASIVVKNAKNKVVSRTFEGLKANAMLTGKIEGLQKFASSWLTDIRNRYNQKSREASLYLSNCQLQASMQNNTVQQQPIAGQPSPVAQTAVSQNQCTQQVQQYMSTLNATFAQEAGRIYQTIAQQAGQISLAHSLGNFMIPVSKDGSVDYSNGGLTGEDIGMTALGIFRLQGIARQFLSSQQLQMGLGNLISQEDIQFAGAFGLIQMDNANGAIQVNNQLPQIPGAPNVQVVQTPGQPSQINTQLAGSRTADRIAGQVQPLPQVAGGMNNGMQGGQLGWNAGRGQMMNGQQFGHNNRTQVWGGQPALQNNQFQQNQFQNNRFQQNQMQQPFVQQQQQMVGQQQQFQNTVPQGTGLNTTLGTYQGVAPFPTVQQNNNNLPVGLLS